MRTISNFNREGARFHDVVTIGGLIKFIERNRFLTILDYSKTMPSWEIFQIELVGGKISASELEFVIKNSQRGGRKK